MTKKSNNLKIPKQQTKLDKILSIPEKETSGNAATSERSWVCYCTKWKPRTEDDGDGRMSIGAVITSAHRGMRKSQTEVLNGCRCAILRTIKTNPTLTIEDTRSDTVPSQNY